LPIASHPRGAGDTMPSKDRLKVLSQSDLFRSLSQEEMEEWSRHSEPKTFKPGQLILNKGEKNDTLFMLASGKVECFLPEQERAKGVRRFSKVRLNTLGPGESFGVYSLIDKQEASCSVMAIEETETLSISRERFEQLVQINQRIGNAVYRNLLNLLVKRLREKDKELDLFLA
jgi:CRP/FNR family cyclic AMP-dependent transcriptional regulator